MQHLLNNIKEPIICAKCLDEMSQGLTDVKSLQDYSKFDIGFTDNGLQVWCRRHDLNVVHIDFEGMMPDADFRCLEKKSDQGEV